MLLSKKLFPLPSLLTWFSRKVQASLPRAPLFLNTAFSVHLVLQYYFPAEPFHPLHPLYIHPYFISSIVRNYFWRDNFLISQLSMNSTINLYTSKTMTLLITSFALTLYFPQYIHIPPNSFTKGLVASTLLYSRSTRSSKRNTS